MNLTENRIKEIALSYANQNHTQHYSLEFQNAHQSIFMDNYWDVSFKVLNAQGVEIDGPLLMAIDDETGKLYTMEEVITININNPDVKIGTDPLGKK